VGILGDVVRGLAGDDLAVGNFRFPIFSAVGNIQFNLFAFLFFNFSIAAFLIHKVVLALNVQKPAANPTIVSNNASAVKICHAKSSLVHFENLHTYVHTKTQQQYHFSLLYVVQNIK
jgi:hypothetical protein